MSNQSRQMKCLQAFILKLHVLDPGIVVGIQRIDRSYSNASLDGDYSCVGLYADSSAAQGPARHHS